MSSYKSEKVTFDAAAEDVFNKLSNLENLKNLIDTVPADKIPAEHLESLQKLEVSSDSITFPGGPMGSLTLTITEKKSPTLIRMEGVGIPMPLSISLIIEPEGPFKSEGQVDITLDLPPLLKPMVGKHIQKMADQFAEMLKAIPFA